MIVAIQHPYEDGIQHDVYQNVASVLWEYQPNNGYYGSYWLTLIFKKGTPEATKYNKSGELPIEISPEKDTFQIYKENK